MLIKALYNLNWKSRLGSLTMISSLFHAPLEDLPENLIKKLSSALNYLKSDSSALVSSASNKIYTELFSVEIKLQPEPVAFNLRMDDIDINTKHYAHPKSSDGLVFALVDESVITEIENESNWRARVLAVQKLESALDELETLEKIVPYLAMLLRLISKLIKDKNFKVSETALTITEKLIKSRELRTVTNFGLILPACIEKLGDNKISIRMNSFKVLRGLLGILRSNLMMPSLLQSLESQNWHIKEECTNLIITALLLNVEFEYSDAIEPLAKLLDDPRPKVRNVSIEAFAVLKTKLPDLEDLLKHLLDKDLFEKLRMRLNNENIVKLTEEYLEYPKLPVLINMSSIQNTTEIRDEIFSARVEVSNKTQEISNASARPTSQIKYSQSVTKSYNHLPRRLSPAPSKVEIESFYLQDDQILPLKNPHDYLMRFFNRDENWEHQFEAINMIRRITKHHPEVLFSKVTLHNVVIDIVKWADSLRSSLAKNALLLLQDMCSMLRKSMDSEVSDILKILLKRAIDTNSFINEQAAITLEAMLSNLSEHKIMPFVIFHCQSTKNAQIKAKLAFCFGRIFRKSKENVIKLRDVEKSLQILADYLSDGALEVRQNAQEAFEELYKGVKSETNLEQLLVRSLKEQLYQKVETLMKKKSRSQSPQKSLSESRISKNSIISLRRHFPKFTLKKSSENFSDFFFKVKESDWRSRYDLITKLAEATKTSNITLPEAEQIVNTLCIGLNDSNIKVQIHTLTTLKKIIPSLKSLLNPSLLQLMKEISVFLNMQNFNLRSMAGELLPILAKFCDVEVLIINILYVLKTCRSRGRIMLLKFLCGQVRSVCEEDLQLFVETLCENLDFPRQDVRAEAEKCIIGLFDFINDRIFQFVPKEKVGIVRQVLNNN